MEEAAKGAELAMLVYNELISTARAVRRELTPLLAERGLTRSQYAVLEAIPPDGTTLGCLARQSGRDPSNITGIVDRLEQSGWIRRDRDDRDRRVITVLPTDEGTRLIRIIQGVLPGHVHRRLSVLTEEEQKLLLRLAIKLRGRVENESQGSGTAGPVRSEETPD